LTLKFNTCLEDNQQSDKIFGSHVKTFFIAKLVFTFVIKI